MGAHLEPHATIARPVADRSQLGAGPLRQQAGRLAAAGGRLKALGELARVAAPSAQLYLHFETSSSFEHVFNAGWNAPNFLNRIP
jgi:hypothetical protein